MINWLIQNKDNLLSNLIVFFITLPISYLFAMIMEKYSIKNVKKREGYVNTHQFMAASIEDNITIININSVTNQKEKDPWLMIGVPLLVILIGTSGSAAKIV